MEQKTGHSKNDAKDTAPRPKLEEVLARNPGLAAILAWELRHKDSMGGYGH